MTERIVVIGSNSFSGSHFVNLSLADGATVMGISRSAQPDEAYLPYRWSDQNGDFSFTRCDLNRELSLATSAIEEFQPDYVVNFSAQGMVAESWQAPADWYETNIVSMVRLHDRLRQLKCLRKYVHVTTPEVYGDTQGWVKEGHSFAPSTPYAVSRAACDMSLRAFCKAYDFPVVFTRAANVYGPGQQLYRIIPRTMVSIRQGKTLPLHGGGTSKRAFIFIDDVATATRAIMRDGTPGEDYHISTQQVVTIRELVELICVRMGADFDQVVEVATERLGKDPSYQLDSGKLRTQLAWEDRVSLGEGLERTCDWIDANIGFLSTESLEYIHKK